VARRSAKAADLLERKGKAPERRKRGLRPRAKKSNTTTEGKGGGGSLLSYHEEGGRGTDPCRWRSDRKREKKRIEQRKKRPKSIHLDAPGKGKHDAPALLYKKETQS